MGRGARQHSGATAAAPARASNEQIRSALRRRGPSTPEWAADPDGLLRRAEEGRGPDQVQSRPGWPDVEVWTDADGRPHRDHDLPAMIVPHGAVGGVDGATRGRSAKIDLLDSTGGRIWAKHGLAHRDNGPALEMDDGGFEYWRDGQLHRTDGPAKERYVKSAGATTQKNLRSPVDREWWVEGRLHRTDGPAIERADGTCEWYVDGVLHRDEDDQPAIQHASGRNDWWVGGKRHRDGGKPARVFANGKKEWWVDGKRHRDDGPAMVDKDGTETFYLKGKKVSAEQYEQIRTATDRLNFTAEQHQQLRDAVGALI